MASRLPTIGGDKENWGEILNDFLRQAHTEEGLMKPQSVMTSQLSLGAVDEPQLSAAVQAKLNAIASNGREIELRSTATTIEWRYTDEAAWTSLLTLADLQGPAGSQGNPGPGIAPGGINGQILVKASLVDFDTTWSDPPVESVNGQTGIVTLNAGSVGADPAGSAGTAEANAATYTDSSISSLETAMETYVDEGLANKANQSSVVGVVNHGANATVARPTGYGSVIWIGTVAPSNRAVGDIWNNVS